MQFNRNLGSQKVKSEMTTMMDEGSMPGFLSGGDTVTLLELKKQHRAATRCIQEGVVLLALTNEASSE